MNVLIFGTERPKFDMKQDPSNGLIIKCKNGYQLDYDPKEEGITWADLLLRTSPPLVKKPLLAKCKWMLYEKNHLYRRGKEGNFKPRV